VTKRLRELDWEVLVADGSLHVTTALDDDKVIDRTLYNLHVADGQLQAKYFKFAVGDRVRHGLRGIGTVTEHMADGRTRVLFDSGEEHKYKPSSMSKLVYENLLHSAGADGLARAAPPALPAAAAAAAAARRGVRVCTEDDADAREAAHPLSSS